MSNYSNVLTILYMLTALASVLNHTGRLHETRTRFEYVAAD